MAKKIEREIEEVLQQLEQFVPEGPPAASPPPPTPPRPVTPSRLGQKLAGISLGQVRLWALGLVIAAFFLRPIPGASWVMLAGLLVFAVACAISLSSIGSAPAAADDAAAKPATTRPSPGWLKSLKSLLRGE